MPDDEEVDIGDPVLLVCDALSVPSPEYTWYKVDCSNSSVRTVIEVVGRLSLSEGNLTIRNTMRSDRGCYVCEVSNDLNRTITSPPARLRVAGMYYTYSRYSRCPLFTSLFPPPPLPRLILLPLPSTAPPIPPTSVSVDSVGSSWIFVTWTAVNNDPIIIHYLVEYKLSFHSNWTSVEREEVFDDQNITMLYPSARYDIRVRSYSPLGLSLPSPTVSAGTLPGIPRTGALESLRDSVELDSNSSDSLTVSWTVPEVSGRGMSAPVGGA